MVSVIAYLNFRGNCREVVEFYAEVFGVEKPKIMTFGDLPPNSEHPIPEEVKNWVMHTMLLVNGSPIMFSDVFPNMPLTMGNNFSLMLHSKDINEVRDWFDKLKEGGRVGMELQETSWTKLYGNVTDKFGIGWQVNLVSEETEM